jgi:hypothetical protein
VAVVGAATAQIAYTASKGGVLAMTREIAVAYAKQGIRANALCPGPVDTPLLQQLLADPAARARRLVHVPMGRLAQAGEIARAALFLASDESSYVNGATFLVDGGITAANDSVTPPRAGREPIRTPGARLSALVVARRRFASPSRSSSREATRPSASSWSKVSRRPSPSLSRDSAASAPAR